LFSGIGAGFASKSDFKAGLGLVFLATLTSGLSALKKLPFLSTDFSLFDYGGRLMRSVLHLFDSTFSTVGEKGACFNLPALLAGGASIFSLSRVFQGKENKSFEMPITTVGGTLGRTAVHHMESMLASKAAYLSKTNEELSAFLAGSATTFGLLAPKEIKQKQLPWKTFEGMISQAGFHFLDSIFSTIGGSFEKYLDTKENMLLGAAGLTALFPILASNKKIWDHKVPFPQVEGKLIRSIFHGIESLIFNVGSKVGNGAFGIPLSIGFTLLTYFATLSKTTNGLFKNFKVPMNTVGGLMQRLPFDFSYSMMSAVGSKISKYIPAPLVVLFGPALSFKLGESFKHKGAKYDELKGLMIRNSVHLMESVLASGAYRTGRLLTGTADEHTSSGSVMADGRWLTDEGRIVPTMAIGKQIGGESSGDILKTILSGFGGVAFGVLAYLASKYLFSKPSSKPLDKEIASAVAQLAVSDKVETFDRFIRQKSSEKKSELSIRAKRAVNKRR